jgi:SAM-dependent methyltransferase
VIPRVLTPDLQVLQQVFDRKYGPLDQCGWGPRMRHAQGHFSPDDWYEALMAQLVRPGVRWLDVGCGRELFPSNRELARILSARCEHLTGLDPDPTLAENPYVHERVAAPMDQWDGQGRFDLVSLRMVAEHVTDPAAVVAAVDRALAPGGVAVVYTVFGWSPAPLVTRLVPMGLRHRLKRWLWGTEEKDTFPTTFRMNTRGRLRTLFARHGMREERFLRLDDCRTFARFRVLLALELVLLRACALVRMPYPEHCLLGVYRKP